MPNPKIKCGSINFNPSSEEKNNLQFQILTNKLICRNNTETHQSVIEDIVFEDSEHDESLQTKASETDDMVLDDMEVELSKE